MSSPGEENSGAEGLVKRQVVPLFLFLSLFMGLSNTVLDPLIPLIARTLSVGYDLIGIALFLGSLFSLLMTFAAGKLSDFLDIKLVILAALGSIFLGFAFFSLPLGFGLFILVVLLLRSGYGALMTSTHTFVGRIFHTAHSPVYVKMDIFWFFGALAGPFIIGLTLRFDVSPRVVFGILALACFLAAFYSWKKCPSLKEPAEGSLPRDAKGEEEREEKSSRSSGASWWKVIWNPVVLLNSCMLFFHTGMASGLLSWLTTYFTGYEIEVSSGSFVLAGYFAVSLTGLLIVSRIMNRISEGKIVLATFITGTLSFFLVWRIPEFIGKLPFLLIGGICFATTFSLSMAISAYEDRENTGTILGFQLTMALLGGIVFQPLYGYAAEYWGTRSVMGVIFFIALAGLGFAAALFIVLRLRRSPAV